MLRPPKLVVQKSATAKGAGMDGADVHDAKVDSFEELLGTDAADGVVQEARCGRVGQMGL